MLLYPFRHYCVHPGCHSSFVRARDLQAHVRQIHGLEVQEPEIKKAAPVKKEDLKCNTCGEQFYNLERLHKHLKHKHEKTFK